MNVLAFTHALDRPLACLLLALGDDALQAELLGSPDTGFAPRDHMLAELNARGRTTSCEQAKKAASPVVERGWLQVTATEPERSDA